LESGAIDPVPGEVLSFAGCTFVQQGPSGAGVEWEFTSLDVVNSTTLSYISLQASGLASTFPTANVIQDNGGGDLVVYRSSAAAYEQLGSASPDDTATCADPFLIMSYPLTFGDAFDDVVDCIETAGSNTYAISGSASSVADGWGTITLPFGTVNNVLRVRRVQDLVSEEFTPATQIRIDDYSWYRPGVHRALFTTARNRVTLFGFLTLRDSASTVIQDLNVGLDELVWHDIGVDAWPNPATDRLEVTFGLSAGHKVSIDVVDITGGLVRTTRRPTLVHGVQREVIDVAGLCPGAYMVRVTDETGATGMRCFIRQ
jgi:hypothetical protein